MSVKRRDLERMLKDNGFTYTRRNKHAVYTDGITPIALPSGSKIKYGMDLKLKNEIKRAVQKREERQKAMGFENRPFQTVKIKTKEEMMRQMNGTPKLQEKPIPAPTPPKIEVVEDIKATTNFGIKTEKYDPITRAKFRARIRELRNIGLSVPETVIKLNEEGWKTPNGDAIELYTVANHLTAIRKEDEKMAAEKKAAKKAAAETPPPPRELPGHYGTLPPVKGTAMAPVSSKLPAFVIEILTNPEFSDSKKIKMLMVYLED